MGPPPSYPPPPVPSVCLLHQDTNAALNKGPPPPIPSQHRSPTSSLSKKPPLSVSPSSTLKESNKGPPPPLPFAPHLPKVSPMPPLPSPSSHKKTFQGRAASVGAAGNEKKDYRLLPTMSVQSPATLPICEQLDRRMALDSTVPCSLSDGGSQSLSSNHRVELSNHSTRPNIPTPSSANRPVNSNCLLPSHPPLPGHSPHSPILRPGQHNPGTSKPFPVTKPPVPGVKPPKPLGTPFQ